LSRRDGTLQAASDLGAPMDILHIFPTAGFDRSTTTPILFGVLISWLFCEAFGWVFAGLVVPGYLAAVFVLDPRAGMMDVGEAILTYGLARFLGEHFARTGLTSRVFGRERFLLVVISSILVRLVVEGAILPRFAPHAAGAFFSIGLVVVPLAANACWKTGLARGIIQNGVPTLLVFLLLRYVLVPYTNLSLAGFELATEDVAATFLASPKAYILLITGAVLAAASNVLDGWDFNGILVPALLALVVIEPVKFAATFVEALVLVLVVAILMRTTRLGRWNVEGPRKLVLFFTIDYVLRFAFAAILGRQMTGFDVVGLMGFGYLLPTLLAVKIAQKGNAALVILPTVQVSVGAFVLGTLIGFCAAMVDTDTRSARAAIARPMPSGPTDPRLAAMWAAGLARNEPREGAGGLATPGESLASLVDDLLTKDDAQRAASMHFVSQRLENGVLLVRESFEQLGDRCGDPTVLTTVAGRTAAKRLIVYVPRPVSSPEMAALAGKLLVDGAIDGVVIAGVEEGDRKSDPFDRSAIDTARALADRRTSGTGEPGVVVALRRATGNATATVDSAAKSPRLDALLATLGDKGGAIARTEAKSQGADVVVNLPESAIARIFDEQPADASFASPAALAAALDGLVVDSHEPSPEDLLALRRLVLDPLLSPPGSPRSWPLLRVSARALGYRLLGPGPIAGGGEGVLLLPGDQPRPLAIVVRSNGVAHTVMEVPQAWGDGTRDLAVRLAASLGSDAILLGLAPGGAARGGEAMRLAHAVSTNAVPGRTPAIVVVRDGGAEWDNAGVVTIGSWGGLARNDLTDSVRKALTGIGLDAADAPIDLAARELSGRAVFGDVPVVSVIVDANALRLISLDDARGTSKLLAASGLPTYDGSVESVADRLARKLVDGAAAAPADLPRLARSAAIDGSIVARRSLAAALATTASGAAVARADDGEWLVVVGRDPSGLMVTVVPTDPRAAKPQPEKTPSFKTLRECTPAIAAGGACRAEAI
jgi:hypothetical protein